MRVLIGAALVLLMVGCGGGVTGAPPKPVSQVHGLVVPKDGLRVLIAGEQFEARAEVLGMNVGRLKVRVSGACDATADPKWGVEAKMATAGVLAFFNKTRGVALSSIDAETAVPSRSETHIEDGEAWRDYKIWAGKERYRFRYEKSEGDLIQGRKPLPEGEPIYDTQTGLFAIRAWQAEPDELGYFYVILGRRLWRADVQFEGSKSIEVGGKKFDTVHFKGVAHRVDLEPGQEYKPRKFSVWLTNDEHRVPVKVAGDGSIGAVTFFLEKHDFEAECRAPDPPKPTRVKRPPRKGEARKTNQGRKLSTPHRETKDGAVDVSPALGEGSAPKAAPDQSPNAVDAKKPDSGTTGSSAAAPAEADPTPKPPAAGSAEDDPTKSGVSEVSPPAGAPSGDRSAGQP